MTNSFLRSLASTLLASTSAALFAQGQSNDYHGSPLDIEARPPIHIRPNVSASPSGYVVTQIKHAYGFDQLPYDGTGQTIAIVDAYGDPTIQTDLDTFCAAMHINSKTVNIAYPGGKPTRKDSGWAMETALDVQWAHAIAPNATILLVIAKSASLSALLQCVDYAASHGAQQVSMSWGSSEFSGEASYDSHFNYTGISFFASSGDNGAGVEWPAVSPSVTGVGGTHLELDSAGNVITPESTWSGSGGGTSSYIVRPAYQNGFNSANYRGVPDVSYDADPNTGFSVYMSNYNGQAGWFTVGGTSAGSPQWAGLMALINQGRGAGKSLSSADVKLYSAAASATYATDYTDIVSGSNGYAATTGYDLATGLGTPKAAALVPALVSAP